ncbi:unnamed protein product [Mycena citricolor]|uniref:Beta-lactamase-related domain-containing protein n=1 Tax=Mycena citricolor TaxID=2018698 RepID=A0AAD2HHA7_9AGAR|nr:unnamed protein product [Mycena citricolor]
MRCTHYTALVLLLSRFSGAASAQAGAFLDARVDAIITGMLRDFNTPGGAGIAVVHKAADGQWVMESKGYGNATTAGQAATQDTLFPIGSNSKLFDAIATGLLISNETLSPRVSWDSKIASLIPEWKLWDPVATRESTIVDLMSHRTGLPRHDFMVAPSDSVLSVIKRLRYLRPSAGFRETWQYSNLMYIVLSHLSTVLTGVPYEKYVSDNIFVPLGMSSTTYTFNDTIKNGKQVAEGLARDGANLTRDPFDLGTVRLLDFWDTYSHGKFQALRCELMLRCATVFSGDGGVISSASDMAIWLRALLEGGLNQAQAPVIPSDVIDKVAEGVTVIPDQGYPEISPIVYGGGQSRGSYRGFEFIEHDGSVPGFNSVVSRLPWQEFGVAVMTNDDSLGSLIAEAIKFRLIDEFLQLKPVDWTSRYRNAIASSLPPPATPRSKHPKLPSVPFTSLAGKYSNPGYYEVDFCLFLDSAQTGQSCKDLDARYPEEIDPAIPTLVADFKVVADTFIRFQHFSGEVWNVSALQVERASVPKEQWIYRLDGLVFEFDGDRGFAALGGFWGAGLGVPDPVGKTAQERAEVWFAKVRK